MSRTVVRAAVAGWLDPLTGSLWDAATPGPPDSLDKVWTAFPKELDYRQYARIEGQNTRCQLVVFLQRQKQRRGSTGWKIATYDAVLQGFTASSQQKAEDAQTDVDVIVDAIETRMLADHTFGQPTAKIFRAAEPEHEITFGEPFLNAAGVTEQWFQISFPVEQWIQA